MAAAAPGPLEAAHGHESGATQGIVGATPVTSVTLLREESTRPADVALTLEASRTTVELASGAQIEAWTYGELGGPAIEATEGDIVEVTLSQSRHRRRRHDPLARRRGAER